MTKQNRKIKTINFKCNKIISGKLMIFSKIEKIFLKVKDFFLLLLVNAFESFILIKTVFYVLFIKRKIPSKNPLLVLDNLYSQKNINTNIYKIQADTTNRKYIMKEIINQGLICNDVSVLDVGCGCGLLAEIINEFQLQVDYTGIDISSYMIKKAKSKFSNSHYKYLIGDFQDLYNICKKQQYDIVVCLAINRFITDKEKFFNQLTLITKPSGCILFRILRNSFFQHFRIFIYKIMSLGTFNGGLSFYKALSEISARYGFKLELFSKYSNKEKFTKGTLGIVKLKKT